MENEMFTFVVCSHEGHSVEYHYCSRYDADKKFCALSSREAASTIGDYVAYYCASVGGLVNSWRAQ